MTHQEIKDKEIVERYALNSLSLVDRRAFQEHFFECDDCFAEAQTASRFIAGVSSAARAGTLAGESTKAANAGWANWFRPAFAAVALAAVVLAFALGWVLLSQIPRLRADVARERQAREQMERENQNRLAQASEALANEQRQREADREKLQELLAQNKTVAPPNLRAQANTSLVILDAERIARRGDHELLLASGSTSATIWIEVQTGNRFDSYRLQILNASGQVIQTVPGAKPNSYGAVAVTIPARSLRPGRHIVKLFGVKAGKSELTGEYILNVRDK